MREPAASRSLRDMSNIAQTPAWLLAPMNPTALETKAMSLGLILVIILVIFLFGGFSGRIGGYGYGYGHGGVGVIGTILIIVVILMLLGRI